MITLWCKHLILRIDDACNFKMDAPKGSVEYPHAIATRAKWSKNVVSFANCPNQIMFGSKRWQDSCSSTFQPILNDGSIKTLMIWCIYSVNQQTKKCQEQT
jgi:hypothetical protein